jgi:START domain
MLKSLFFVLLISLTAYGSPNKNWEFQTEKNGISVYKAFMAGTKIAGARGEAIIESPMNRILFVLSDIEKAGEWIDRLTVSKVLERNGLLETVVYQEFSLPWPISDRSFVFRGKARKEEDGRVIIELKSEDNKLAPPSKGVRGELIESKYVLTPISDTQTKLEVEIFADPKGAIPTWLINLIQKSWPIKTISAIRTQVAKPYVVNANIPKTIIGL